LFFQRREEEKRLQHEQEAKRELARQEKIRLAEERVVDERRARKLQEREEQEVSMEAYCGERLFESCQVRVGKCCDECQESSFAWMWAYRVRIEVSSSVRVGVRSKLDVVHV